MTRPSKHWAKDVTIGTRGLSLVGATGIGVFMLGFGAWAAYAPLSGAAVAPGYVAAAGQNRHIQHFEGGIIDEIRVREGDRVEEGQILLQLDATSAEARHDRLEQQVIALEARATRLMAERDGHSAVDFDADLRSEAGKVGLEGLLTEQDQEFVARLERHRQEGVILRQRVNSLNEQIAGLASQQTAVETQIDVVHDESERKRLLLDRGLTDRSEYTALLRSEADLVGQLGQARASILSAQTQIIEAEEQYSRLNTQRVETAASELNELRTEISGAREELRAARAVLGRVQVRAPSDGIVVSMTPNSRGSVIEPGVSVLELLPTDDDLVIEARISPSNIDIVRLGQTATLRFSALNSRTTPVVPAVVTYVSADRLMDTGDGQPYYVARLRITGDLPEEIRQEQIYPGMPVDTFITTGDRTFLEYLGKPISDSFSRAFREN